MTIASALNYLAYTISGQTSFAITMPFYSDSDIRVAIVTDGVREFLTLNVDYTITGGDGSTGNVVFGVAPSGDELQIWRWQDLIQDAQQPTTGLQIEQSLDKVVMMIQQVAQRQGALTFSESILSFLAQADDGTDNWDAQGERLVNLGEPEENNDAVRLIDVQDLVTGTGQLPTTTTPGQDDYMLVSITGTWTVRSPSQVRTSLGLGSMATQAAGAVAVTGGTVVGITDLAIADGGTGASTAANAFTALKQNASTSATGVVELATDAEVLAQTSGVVPTANQLGKGPLSPKAWINFRGTTLAGTYNRSGTTVTIAASSHGMSTGMKTNLSFSAGTGGTATNGTYTVTVVDANTFTVTDSASGTITGSAAVTLNFIIYDSENIATLVKNGAGDWSVTFTTALANAFPGMTGVCDRGATDSNTLLQWKQSAARSSTTARFATMPAGSGTLTDFLYNSVMFWGR